MPWERLAFSKEQARRVGCSWWWDPRCGWAGWAFCPIWETCPLHCRQGGDGERGAGWASWAPKAPLGIGVGGNWGTPGSFSLAPPRCFSHLTLVWMPLPELSDPQPWDGSCAGRAPGCLPGGAGCAVCRGRVKRIYKGDKAQLPAVIAPHTIRGCAGNFGAADRYTALIQLSSQPLLAKIRGNWYYKWFLGKCLALVLNDLSAIIHT